MTETAEVPAGPGSTWRAFVRLGVGLGAGAGALVLGFGFSMSPWVTVGAAMGAVLFFAAIRWPLAMVGVFLTLGPVDLAVLTGGFKGLAPELGGLDMNGIRLVAVSAGLGAVVLLDQKLRHLLVSPHARWYLLFLAWGALSIPLSVDPMEGARLLFKLTWPFLIFLIVAHPDRTPGERDRLGDWVLIGAAVIMLVNPFFVWAGAYHVDFHGRFRVLGPGVYANPFSFYLLFVAILALTRFAFRAQLRYLFLATGALVWVGLTQTRITFLAGLVALAAAGLYAGFVQKNRRMTGLVGGAVVVLGLIFVPIALQRTFGYVPGPADLWTLMRDPILFYGTIDLAGRELYWGLLYTAWSSSPWLGLGLGSSSGIIHQFIPPELGAVAHSEYFRLGTDLGFLGLGLVALITWAWARPAWAGGEWAFPALAGLLVWVIISLTDNALDYYASFTQFVGFAVAVALTAGRGEDATSAADPGASSSPPGG
jgi:hypothetical protein